MSDSRFNPKLPGLAAQSFDDQIRSGQDSGEGSRIQKGPFSFFAQRDQKPKSKLKKGDIVISAVHGPARQIAHVDNEFNWITDNTDRFTFNKKLGEGAMGSVHLAYVPGSDFPLAVKKMKLGTTEDKKQELKKEMDILRKCSHNNIVKYYGCIFTSEECWLMMDYCEGGSIYDLLRELNITFSELQIGGILRATVAGLSYLHSMNIVHRDIKSANILVTKQGCKIADFGVSYQLGKATEKVNTIIGTPLFMSPETLSGELYDTRCDIWSLGITCIEMAEGRPPYFELNLMRAMLLIATEEPPKLKEQDKWSKDFVHFLMRCLQKKSTKRATTLELLEHPFITTSKQADTIVGQLLQMVKEKEDAKSRDDEKMRLEKEEKRLEEEKAKRIAEEKEKEAKVREEKKRMATQNAVPALKGKDRPIAGSQEVLLDAIETLKEQLLKERDRVAEYDALVATIGLLKKELQSEREKSAKALVCPNCSPEVNQAQRQFSDIMHQLEKAQAELRATKEELYNVQQQIAQKKTDWVSSPRRS
eukprot:TRINITY_DN7877_c0_g1_i1.p1 TRINITY_DN7877_c0_g1~~TRINITY_DN7877_c0_g1_i1.p1  ORF type:complete len:533 (-),score=184.66 TRINITY_DN7877_c0_g1_i1:76-1674(-)